MSQAETKGVDNKFNTGKNRNEKLSWKKTWNSVKKAFIKPSKKQTPDPESMKDSLRDDPSQVAVLGMTAESGVISHCQYAHEILNSNNMKIKHDFPLSISESSQNNSASEDNISINRNYHDPHRCEENWRPVHHGGEMRSNVSNLSFSDATLAPNTSSSTCSTSLNISRNGDDFPDNDLSSPVYNISNDRPTISNVPFHENSSNKIGQAKSKHVFKRNAKTTKKKDGPHETLKHACNLKQTRIHSRASYSPEESLRSDASGYKCATTVQEKIYTTFPKELTKDNILLGGEINSQIPPRVLKSFKAKKPCNILDSYSSSDSLPSEGKNAIAWHDNLDAFKGIGLETKRKDPKSSKQRNLVSVLETAQEVPRNLAIRQFITYKLKPITVWSASEISEIPHVLAASCIVCEKDVCPKCRKSLCCQCEIITCGACRNYLQNIALSMDQEGEGKQIFCHTCDRSLCMGCLERTSNVFSTSNYLLCPLHTTAEVTSVYSSSCPQCSRTLCSDCRRSVCIACSRREMCACKPMCECSQKMMVLPETLIPTIYNPAN